MKGAAYLFDHIGVQIGPSVRVQQITWGLGYEATFPIDRDAVAHEVLVWLANDEQRIMTLNDKYVCPGDKLTVPIPIPLEMGL